MTSTVPQYLQRFPWENRDTHSSQYLQSIVLELAGPLTFNTRVLDVGCGTGSMMKPFLRAGCDVTGIDPSTDAINHARVRLNEFRYARLIQAQADDSLSSVVGADYDLVVSTEVIEHVYDPRVFISGCKSVLKPGGRLILSTPYHGYTKNLALSLFDKWDFHLDPLYDGGHIKFWSRHTLTALLTEAGFTDFVFRGAGRVPYLWKSLIVSARYA